MYHENSAVPKGCRKYLFDTSDFDKIQPQAVEQSDILSVSREDLMQLVKSLHDVYAELDRVNLFCREKAMRGVAVSALSPNTAVNMRRRYFFKWRKWLDQRHWQHQGECVQGELERCVWCQPLSSAVQLIQRRLGLELALRQQQDVILIDQKERIHYEHLAVSNIAKHCRDAEGRLNIAVGMIRTILAKGQPQPQLSSLLLLSSPQEEEEEEQSVQVLRVLPSCEEKSQEKMNSMVMIPPQNFYERESMFNSRVLMERELRCGTRLFGNFSKQQQQEEETSKQWIPLTTNTGFSGMNLPFLNSLAQKRVLPNNTLS
ncbi:uncharacterized protein TM35_000091190 [Trypanosoma theileri]|uniref:Uncharacterized protein n=1 Tax=Trypanosoma theileri TaxID=67003 RepID=A0A1X0P0P0_9TRYP|nr:uncharacterized protein TM35_000091190 [Trypanosoma theileri]ORC90069.1 hypothetical protein TM35_000091190 [Trypanosoma theileri]